MNRRDLLKGILAAGCAPAFIRYGSLMVPAPLTTRVNAKLLALGHSYGMAQAELIDALCDALWQHPLERFRPMGVYVLSPAEERSQRATGRKRTPGTVTVDEFTEYVRRRYPNGYDGGPA